MSLYERYDLLEAFSSGQTGTVRARDRSSGAEVLIHFLARGRETESVKEQVRTLASPAREHVLEIGDHDAMSFLVTTTDVPRLDEWLKSMHDPRRLVRAGAWKLPSVPKNGAPGEFTQMFNAPVQVATQEMPLPPVAPMASAQPAPAVTTDRGEFTQMFHAPVPAATQEMPLPPIAPAASAQPAPVVTTDRGEFTQMFHAPVPAATQEISLPPIAPAASAQPAPVVTTDRGEFTQMFHAPVPAATQEIPLPPIAPVASAQVAPRPASDPGEFTRVFQAAAGLSPSASVRSTSATGGGEFTRMLHAAPQSASLEAMASSTTQKFVPRKPAPPSVRDQGEFTRMFQAPASPAPVSAPPGAPATPAAARSAMSLGATGAFGGMGVLQPAEPGTGPSEFTRMIAVPSLQSSAAAVLPGTPAQSAPAEPPKKAINIALLVAIFEGVVILALVLILFFALKK